MKYEVPEFCQVNNIVDNGEHPRELAGVKSDLSEAEYGQFLVCSCDSTDVLRGMLEYTTTVSLTELRTQSVLSACSGSLSIEYPRSFGNIFS